MGSLPAGQADHNVARAMLQQFAVITTYFDFTLLVNGSSLIPALSGVASASFMNEVPRTTCLLPFALAQTDGQMTMYEFGIQDSAVSF